MWGKNRKIQELKDEMAAMVQRHDREIMQVHKGCAAKVMILERDLASQKSIAQTANKVADMHRRAEKAWERAMMKTVGEDGIKSAVDKIDSISHDLDALMITIGQAFDIVSKDDVDGMDSAMAVLPVTAETNAAHMIWRMYSKIKRRRMSW
jgi:hypothetical protein